MGWRCTNSSRCLCCCRKQEQFNDGESRSLNESTGPQKPPRSCLCKVLIWTSIILAVLLLLAFFTIFVILPLVFQNTPSLQTSLIFLDFDQPENPQYENYELYDAVGVRNFYIDVVDKLNPSKLVSLGIWQILPTACLDDPANDNSVEYFENQIKRGKKPIAIYFHGQSGTRIISLPTYNKLREFFHVIAMDYRHYGDSSEAELTEDAVVDDLVQLYKKILGKIEDDTPIYFWGHSLGTALSTHTLKRLTVENKKSKPYRLPKGLMLEAPFTTMREEITYHPIGKIFAWLPWFASTILDPLEETGLRFWTTTNILNVNCPIMIMHAEDDSMIPYTLGEKLYNVARTERDLTVQGDVRFHLIPSTFKSDHLNINTYPGFLGLIEDFLASIP